MFRPLMSAILCDYGGALLHIRDGRGASADDGTADHRRQNLHQRRRDETVLSQHRRQLTNLLHEIEGTEVRQQQCR